MGKSEMKLIYEKPALRWIDGLPLGNGRLAVMVQETQGYDEFSMNHELLWGGGHDNRHAKQNAAYLPAVRQLFREGRYFEGAYLTNFFFSGHNGLDPVPPKLHIPALAGQVAFHYDSQNVHFVRRSLDIRTGVAELERTVDGALVSCRSFVSCADGKFYIRWQSETPFSGLLRLHRTPVKDHLDDTPCADPHCLLQPLQLLSNGLILEGVLLEDIEKTPVIGFGCCASFSTDGKASGQTEGVHITDACCVTVAVDIHTFSPEESGELASRLPDANVAWIQTLQAHTDRFSAMMDRVSFSLCSSAGNPEEMTITQRVERLKAGFEDNGLCKLYFDFGRYLMLSSTILAELPIHLQGKWNHMTNPPWASDYHMNINLQMNYWAAESVALPEAAKGLIHFLLRQIPAGQDNAGRLYGCRGILFPQSCDMSAGFYGVFGWTAWIGAAAWLAQHVWWHYTYSGDISFLRHEGYAYLKQVALFYEDYLIADEAGIYHICPSHSPENRVVSQPGLPVAICCDCAMDIQLAYDGLSYAIQAAELLEMDAESVKRWKHIREHLPKCQIGTDGRLMEWDQEFEESDPGHRHLSHLYGLYPADLFTLEKEPALYQAAVRSLEDRMEKGGGPTGWSRAWCACLFARLGRKQEFYEHYTMLIREFAAETLLDLHPPHIFQIDGNLGGVAAVVEAVISFYDDKIHLLPGLPGQWHDGHLHGIKVPGGHIVDLNWSNGNLTGLRVTMGYKETAVFCYGDKVMTATGKQGTVVTLL